MSTPSKSRLSSVVTEPFDPAIYQWDEGDESAPGHGPPENQHPHPSPGGYNLSSPGFDPLYPFSPFGAPAGSGTAQHDEWRGSVRGDQARDELYVSPENSPMLRSALPGPGFEYHPGITSSAQIHQTAFPPPVAGSEMRPLRIPTHDTSQPIRYEPASFSKSSTYNEERRMSTYTIPEAPPPPQLPLDIDSSQHYGGADMETQRRRRSQRISRQGTVGWNLGSKIMGTVRRSRTSARWGTMRKSLITGPGGDDGDGNYMELRGVEEGEQTIDFDISTFGPEFAVPQLAAKAMNDNEFNEDMAYTGTGEAIDLTSLTGFGDEGQKDSDFFPTPSRAGTFENTNKQSFFFTPGRHVPNWKPVVLQTWYLISLIIITIGMIVGVEVLFRLSDGHVLRKGPGREGGGLFAYHDINDLSVLQFAIWKYVPTLIGVLYGILWKVTDEELKRSEPYYQLSKGSTGALAAESLNVEYKTVWSPMVPVTAIKYRQFAVAAGGVVSFVASSSVPVFLSVLIRVDPSQKERRKMKDNGANAVKRIVVDGLWTRLLEVNLVFIVILASYIVFKLRRRRSGLLGDPSGIAGVAAMANKSHILMDFKNLDLATEETIHKQLNKRTYILHKGALWQAQVLRESERDQSAPKPMNPHPLLLRKKGMGPFLGFCLLMLALLPVIVFNDTANIIIDKAPWIITGISILIKSIWELLDKEMRMLEPFWILFNRNAHSSVLTLDYSATIPGFIILKALSKGHWLLAWVTFVTILIEVLTVVLGSLDAQGGEESGLSSLLSFILAIIIFFLVFITGILVLHKRRHPFLPRQPGTISSVLAFIHQSHMLTDFGGTELLTTLARKKKLANIGKQYGFGWYLGRDGKRHAGIDHEPLLEGYKFGADPYGAVMDEPVGWDVYDPSGG